MFIYQVTITLQKEVQKKWLRWMKETHIPDVMKTGCFSGYRICKVILPADEISYTVQYVFSTMTDFEKYSQHHAPSLQRKHAEKFAGKFTASRCVLEIIA